MDGYKTQQEIMPIIKLYKYYLYIYMIPKQREIINNNKINNKKKLK